MYFYWIFDLFLLKPIGFIRAYISTLSTTLSEQGHKISASQQLYLAILLSVILLCNRICWSDVELTSMGKISAKSVWWMYAKSKLPWDALLTASISMMLTAYGITKGVLAIDDTDNGRAKKTPLIAYTHKYYDKKTGGYKNGQELVFMVLITDKITLPVGFAFYEPDQGIEKWKKENAQQIKDGVAKEDRSKRPKPSADYRSKTQLGARLIKDFKEKFPPIKIQAVLAYALYGSKSFYNDMPSDINQIVSHLKKDQCLVYQGKHYFKRCLNQLKQVLLFEEVKHKKSCTEQFEYTLTRTGVNDL